MEIHLRLIYGAAEGSGKEVLEDRARRALGRDSGSGTDNEKLRARPWILHRVTESDLGGFEILFGVDRREEQCLGRIVEALAAGAIGWQCRADINVEVQQIANRGAVLGAAQ